MVVRTEFQANESWVERNQPEVEPMYLYLTTQSYFMQLIHAKIVNLRHEVHDIPLHNSPALIPKHNGVDGLDGSDDGVEHEDERASLEVIDGLGIVLEEDYLVIGNQVA